MSEFVFNVSIILPGERTPMPNSHYLKHIKLFLIFLGQDLWEKPHFLSLKYSVLEWYAILALTSNVILITIHNNIFFHHTKYKILQCSKLSMFQFQFSELYGRGGEIKEKKKWEVKPRNLLALNILVALHMGTSHSYDQIFSFNQGESTLNYIANKLQEHMC